MSIQGDGDVLLHRICQHASAAKISTTLARNTESQVTCARLTMLRLARGSEAKSLFRTFMRLHLWHGNTLDSRQYAIARIVGSLEF